MDFEVNNNNNNNNNNNTYLLTVSPDSDMKFISLLFL